MASDTATKTVNGNYGSQTQYDSGEQQLSSQGLGTPAGAPPSGPTGAEVSKTSNVSAGTSAASTEGSSSIPKDEVGWYFVEQYYTTLSKNPEKLHVSLCRHHYKFVDELTLFQLFYNKRSQFVSGLEAEKVSVSVGQRVCHCIVKMSLGY